MQIKQITAALSFLYLLCSLPVTKLGFNFSDRWHILSSFRGKSLWNYFIAFLVPNQHQGVVGGYGRAEGAGIMSKKVPQSESSADTPINS